MGARILLVEDNAMNRQLIRDILEYRGHEVIDATGFEEALEQVEAWTPDIALLDIQIPGGSGEALLHEMRKRPSLARMPAVAVTAEAMQGDRERFLAAGFDGYIGKPVDTRALGPMIEALIARGRRPR